MYLIHSLTTHKEKVDITKRSTEYPQPFEEILTRISQSLIKEAGKKSVRI